MPVGATRAAVVTQEGVGVQIDAGVEQRVFMMGEGETAKDLETVDKAPRREQPPKRRLTVVSA